MILNRFSGLFRFSINHAEKLRIEEKMSSDRYRLTNNIEFHRNAQRVVSNNYQANKNDPIFLERNEIETRILKRLHESELVDLRKFKFNQDLRKDLKLDSLNVVVLLTEIEQQFTTVFEDRVFESARNIEELIDILVRDPKIF